MGVLWTLADVGPCTFRTLQSACESISPSVLNQRLKELQAAGFVERTSDGYNITPLGRQIYASLVPLGRIAKEWGEQLARTEE